MIKNIFCSLMVLWSPLGQASSPPSEVKILLAFDESGSLKTTARLLTLGAELALRKQSKLQDNVKLEKLDIGSDVQTIAARLQEQIQKSKPNLIIGAITSNQALIIGDIAERNRIPFLTPFATNPRITEGKRFVFRTCFDDAFQASTLARFTYKEKNLKNGVILFNNEQAYAKGIEAIFASVFKSYPKTKLESIGLTSEQSIDTKMIENLKRAAPEFILLPSYQIESAAIIARLSPHLRDTVFIGPDSWGGGRIFEGILKAKGSRFRGFYVQHWSDMSLSASNKRFLELLKHESIPDDLRFSGTAMNSPIAAGYDAMNIALMAVQNKPFSLLEGLLQVRYSGATGTTVFGNHQTPRKQLFIYSISEAGEKFLKEYQ